MATKPTDADRLVPDPGDVKAATPNPKFEEQGQAPPPPGEAGEHLQPSAGGTHTATEHVVMDAKAAPPPPKKAE